MPFEHSFPDWNKADLIAWRDQHDLSQEQASAILGVSKRQIILIEQGAAAANGTMKMMADYYTSVFGVPPKLDWNIKSHGSGFEAWNNYMDLATHILAEGGVSMTPSVNHKNDHDWFDKFALAQDGMRAILVEHRKQNDHLAAIARTIGYLPPPEIAEALEHGHWIQKDARGYWALTAAGRKRIGKRGRITKAAP